MIVLDTDVVSAMMRPEANAAVVKWLNTQELPNLWLTAISVFELEYGIMCLPDGQRKTSLAARLDVIRTTYFTSRVLAMDELAAERAARAKHAALRVVGYCDEPDAMIAGIAIARGGSVATRNVDHFKHFGVPLINPWNLT